VKKPNPVTLSQLGAKVLGVDSEDSAHGCVTNNVIDNDVTVHGAAVILSAAKDLWPNCGLGDPSLRSG
jgi:hypothetical protein